MALSSVAKSYLISQQSELEADMKEVQISQLTRPVSSPRLSSASPSLHSSVFATPVVDRIVEYMCEAYKGAAAVGKTLLDAEGW